MVDYKISEQNNTGTFKMQGSISIENLLEIKEILLDFVNRYKNIVIDLTDIEEMDLASLQLILSSLITIKQKGLKFSLMTEENIAWNSVIKNAGIAKVTLDKLLGGREV